MALIGRELAALRVLNGVPAFRVAVAAGMHPNTLSAMENGRKPITPETAERIKQAITEIALGLGK